MEEESREKKQMRINIQTPQSLVTEEHVAKALLADKGNSAALLSWKVVDFTNKGDNYASVVSSVEVNYSLNGNKEKVSYVVKLNPCRSSENFETYCELMFTKEMQFLMELVPELNSLLGSHGLKSLHFPRCIYGSLDSFKQQLYLEDMRCREFKMLDKRQGLDLAHSLLVLEQLGRLHAASILLEYRKGEAMEIKHSYLEQDFFNAKEDTCVTESYINIAIDMLKRAQGYERTISWAEKLKPNLGYLLSEGMQSSRFNAVNHGDCWINNIIFRYNDQGDPLEAILLDLQYCRKVSLAIDLNYFIYTSIDGTNRKSNLEKFLSSYYNSFRKVMEAGGLEVPFTEVDLLEEFRNKNVIMAFFGMRVIPTMLMDPEDFPELTGSDDDNRSFLSRFRTKALEMVDKNPLLKSRFFAMFDEFMEAGVIP